MKAYRPTKRPQPVNASFLQIRIAYQAFTGQDVGNLPYATAANNLIDTHGLSFFGKVIEAIPNTTSLTDDELVLKAKEVIDNQ